MAARKWELERLLENNRCPQGVLGRERGQWWAGPGVGIERDHGRGEERVNWVWNPAGVVEDSVRQWKMVVAMM